MELELEVCFVVKNMKAEMSFGRFGYDDDDGGRLVRGQSREVMEKQTVTETICCSICSFALC